MIFMIDIGQGYGYYSNATCSSDFISGGGVINGTTFTFSDNTPIYFGSNALSALSGHITATQCISLLVAQGSSYEIALQIQNLNCTSGTTCSGGNVCYTHTSGWSPSSTPAC